MKRGILSALSWLLTALLGFVEAGMIWLWQDRLRYAETFGAAENLRAAEEAANAGVVALLLLPLFLTVLACAIACTGKWKSEKLENGGEYSL